MESIGRYFIFLYSMFTNRERLKVRIQRTLDEFVSIGVESVPIIVVVSTFVGAVTCIQVYFNIYNPFVENFIVGYAVRNMTILEMSPTVMAIIFAGRVGSSIAGQLGSMRITEQIDALEIMGINTNSYLVMPKIIAAVLSYPLLVILSIFSSIFAGLLAAQLVLDIPPEEYIRGLRYAFDPYIVRFALYKSMTFAFLVTSISSYRGFYTTGGAAEVGAASTQAVTESCIAILLADYVLTQLLLQGPTSAF